jgi:hypothetical protein
MTDFIRTLLDSLNEILAAGIVIVSASLLLYNLSRNLNNPIARVSAMVLGCVTIVYIGDVLTGLNPTLNTWEAIIRFQWIGLALIPATTFHLSDVLLATTGLHSRGRRRRIARQLYILGTVFLLLAIFTNLLIEPVVVDDFITLKARLLFPLYMLYFLITNCFALLNTWRAKNRCLTSSTQRRMTYLLVALLMPSIGIFPYSVFLDAGQEFTLFALLMVNIGNIIVILMLLLLAYPLSFFGSIHPDRIVKAELLRFMLVGPATAMIALAVIVMTEPATQIIGVIGRDFMPFAVVAIILLWQWSVSVCLPYLERWLVYNQEDDEQLSKLQHLTERLLTRADLLQLLEGTLEGVCDYLQVNSAFTAMIINDQADIVKTVGEIPLVSISGDELTDLVEKFHTSPPYTPQHHNDYWVYPLYSGRLRTLDGQKLLIGIMGIYINGTELDTEPETQNMLRLFVKRSNRTLDDLILQAEVYASLEGLLPQFTTTRQRASEVEYRIGRDNVITTAPTQDREQITEQVHAALRHWWGGPGLNSSRLIELQTVQNRLAENENNTSKAIRDALLQAIESLRPDGDRDYRSQEWLFYNILTLRFIDSKKARDTARRLFIGEATLYRKQNAAIEAVVDALLSMERDAISSS